MLRGLHWVLGLKRPFSLRRGRDLRHWGADRTATPLVPKGDCVTVQWSQDRGEDGIGGEGVLEV